MGESEFMLDSLPIEDALRMIGDKKAAPARRPAPSPDAAASRSVRDDAPGATGNWKDALKAIGADGPSGKPASPALPRKGTDKPPVAEPVAEARATDEVESATDTAPAATPKPVVAGGALDLVPGLVVGGLAREHLEGPLSHLMSLDAIAQHIAGCNGCELYKTAKNPVPGEGNPHAGFVCVGEAPGQTEDETGRPFVGRAGDLLTKILEAVHFKREDVFICNVLKHRPPGNRNPAPDEIKACGPYLLRQLELLKPRVILALGTFAAQTLLQTTQPIGKLRGQVHRFHGVPLIVTYHPAALLRNPAWKRPAWEDVQLARRIYDSAVQG
jgi:DNA polymerase